MTTVALKQYLIKHNMNNLMNSIIESINDYIKFHKIIPIATLILYINDNEFSKIVFKTVFNLELTNVEMYGIDATIFVYKSVLKHYNKELPTLFVKIEENNECVIEEFKLNNVQISDFNKWCYLKILKEYTESLILNREIEDCSIETVD